MGLSVPRREGGLVRSEPLPIVHPGAAFQPAPPVNLDPLTKAIGELFAEKQDQADQTAVIDADTKLAAAQDNLLYNPQTGALNRRGKDALQGQLDAEDAWKRSRSDIENGLNDRQKLAFQRAAAVREDGFRRSLMQHVSSELYADGRATTAANLDQEFSLITKNFQDPVRVQAGIDHQRAVIMLDARQTGESNEVTQARIAAATSRSRAAVVELHLANGNDLAAQKYFDDHRADLTTGDVLRLEPQLELGSVRGESQRQADAILGATQTMDSAMKRAALLTDPRVRQATEERIRQGYQDRAAEARADSAAAFREARGILERTGDIHSIPPALILRLSPDDNSSLQHRQDQIRNPKRVTNPDLYFSLINSASLSPATRQQFQQMDLSQYRDQLSEADYQRLLSIQRSGRDRTQSAADRDAKKAADRAAARDVLEAAGVHLPPPTPGGPRQSGTGAPTVNSSGVPSRSSAADAQLPPLTAKQRADAQKNPGYATYLRNLGYQIP